MASSVELRVGETEKGTCTIAPSGQIDSETHEQFENLLKPVLDKKPTKVLFDMKHCDYVSSAGIRVLFDFRKKVQAYLGVVTFYDLQPQIQKVFEIVKALPLECVFSNEAEADAYLDRMMAEALKNKPSEG